MNTKKTSLQITSNAEMVTKTPNGIMLDLIRVEETFGENAERGMNNLCTEF